jgi:hypothetical protein
VTTSAVRGPKCQRFDFLKCGEHANVRKNSPPSEPGMCLLLVLCSLR